MEIQIFDENNNLLHETEIDEKLNFKNPFEFKEGKKYKMIQNYGIKET